MIIKKSGTVLHGCITCCITYSISSPKPEKPLGFGRYLFLSKTKFFTSESLPDG